MPSHVKTKQWKVKTDATDTRALEELVKREKNIRRDPQLGGATLLREYAMPRVQERLAELRALEAEPASV